MVNNQEMMLNSIAIKVAKIEAHIEHQKETLLRIDKALNELEPLKKEVHRNGLILKTVTWCVGVFVSLVSTHYIRGM